MLRSPPSCRPCGACSVSRARGERGAATPALPSLCPTHAAFRLAAAPAGVCTRYLQTHSDHTVPTLQLTVVVTVVAGAGLILFIALPTWAQALFAAARRRHQRRCAARAAELQQAPEGGKQAAAQHPAALDVAAVSVAVGVPADGSRSAAEGQQDDVMLAALMLRSHSSFVTSARLKLEPQPSLLTAAAAARERRRAWQTSYGAAAVIGTVVALQALTLVRLPCRLLVCACV